MRPLAALVCALALLLSACGADGDAPAPMAESEQSASTDVEGTSGPTPTDPSPSVDAGAETPEVLAFTSETVGGEAFDGADLAGKPTVFWFWAPWCPTCRAQIPVVSEIAEAYGADVNVVGIGSLDEPEAIEEFASDVSPDVTLLTDSDGAVWRHFGVTAQSTYLVLDENGAEQASGNLADSELAALVGDLAG